MPTAYASTRVRTKPVPRENKVPTAMPAPDRIRLERWVAGGRGAPAWRAAAAGPAGPRGAPGGLAGVNVGCGRGGWPVPGWGTPGWPVPGWPVPGWPVPGWPVPGWPVLARTEHQGRRVTAVVDGQAARGRVDLGQHGGNELLERCRGAAGQARVDPP